MSDTWQRPTGHPHPRTSHYPTSVALPRRTWRDVESRSQLLARLVSWRLKAVPLVVGFAACLGANDTVSVALSQVPHRLTVSPVSMDIGVGEYGRFEASVADANGRPISGAAVEWSSSLSTVASVDATGYVNALAEGESTITAKVGSVSGTASLTVSGPPEPGMIQDLGIVSTTDTSVVLRWTQVDDGLGGPALYQLRYASPTLDVDSTGTSVVIAGTAVGAILEHTVAGLRRGSPYEFQLAAFRGAQEQEVVFGAASNTASGRTTGEPPVPTIIRLSPEALSLEAGTSATVAAVVEDQLGIEMTGEPVSWTSADTTVATVASSGEVTARSSGSTSIVAKAGTASGVLSVAVLDSGPPPSDGPHAHEPTGYDAVAENSFDRLEPRGWNLYPEGTSNLRIEADDKAALAPNNVGVCVFEAGRKGGTGPMTLSYSNFAGMRSVYVTFDYKVSVNWFNHSAGTKILFVTDPTLGASAPFYLVMFGAGNDRMRFQVNSQSVESRALPDASNAYRANVGSPGDDTIERGKWYEIELILTLNHVGSEDGEIHAWINGRKVIEYVGLQLVGAKSDGTFNTVKWNPTFGGGNHETVPTTQFQYLDNLYISGRN